MRVERFEDLRAWQMARELAREIYLLTRGRDLARDYGLSSQLQRSAVSIMANLAEGFDREGPVEFHRYVTIARGSCSELKSHLYVAHDVGYLVPAEFERLTAIVNDLTKIVGALRKSLKSRTTK